MQTISSIDHLFEVIILGGATNSRAWSAYVDSLFEDAVANFTMTHVASWDVGPPIAR